MNTVNWKSVIVFGIIVVIVLLIGLSLFGGSGYRNWGMMGPGMMGGWGYSPFGWIGMLFMWLIPISFLVLTVLGIVWLVRATIGSPPNVDSATSPATDTCPSCGRPTQTDWQHCPYCGGELK